MITSNKRLLTNILLLSFIALASCNRNSAERVAVKPGQAESKKEIETPEYKTPSDLPRGSVAIMPVKPTVESDLQAVFSGNARSIDYRWERNGEPMEGESGAGLDRKNFKKNDVIRIVVTANGMETDVSVTIADAPPAVTRVTLFPRDIWRGKDITAEAEGKDPDGDAAAFDYQWIINGSEASMQNSPVLKGDQFRRGDTVTVKVLPSAGGIKGDAFSPPPVVVQNAHPQFTSTPPREFTSLFYTYQAKAVDPDGDSVVYSLASAPEGMKIGKNGQIEWTIENRDKGAHTISIVADDGLGGRTSQDYRIMVENTGQ